MTGDASLLGSMFGTLKCSQAFDCNLDFDMYGGIMAWIGLMLYMFKALGTICDEYFVPSLETIVEKLQVSNDVAGATFMAAGSSAPELFTSLVATFLIVNEGGVGTIVGSAIFNILVIVGVTGWVACKDQDLVIWWYPLSRDTFFYCVAIVEMMIVLSDEEVMWYEALIMFLTYLCYVTYMVFNPKIVKYLGIADGKDEIEDIEGAGDEGPTEQVTATDSQKKVEALPAPDGAKSVEDLRVEAQSEELPPGPPDHHLGRAENPETHGPGQVPELESGKADGPSDSDLRTGGSKDMHPAPAPRTDSAAGNVLKVHNSAEWMTDMRGGSKGSGRSPRCGSHSPRGEVHLVTQVEWSHHRTPSFQAREAEADKIREELAAKMAAGEITIPAAAETDAEGGRRCLRDPMNVMWEKTLPTPEFGSGFPLFSGSILWIGICTYVMVDATMRIGIICNVPTLAMALVFLAAGTSIPDALGSVAVAKQGEGDMAIANALGSNVFDILIGLGIPWLIRTGIMGKKVEFKGTWNALKFDIIILIFVLVLFVGALILHRWRLTRPVGVLLICFYFMFLVYNVCAVWWWKIKEADDE